MKKQIIFTMASAICIMLITLISCSKNDSAKAKEKDLLSKENIRDFTKEFIQTRYVILYSKISGQDEKNNFIKLTDGGEWSSMMLTNIQADRAFLFQFGDFSCNTIEIQITVDTMYKLTENSVEASVSEITKLARKYGPDSTLTETITTDQHTITIQNRGNGNWVATSFTTVPFFRPSDWHPTMPPGIGGGPPPVLPLKYYNGVAAANYAIQNVHSGTVPCYSYYASGGGDCTNFVSYCLKQGGWVEDNILWKRATNPDCKNASHSWTVADDFVGYAINSGRTSPFDITVSETSIPFGQFNTLQLGDIVSFDVDRNGRYDHNVIVTKKDNWIFFTYHTTNTLNISVGEFLMKLRSQNGVMPKVKAIRINPSYHY